MDFTGTYVTMKQKLPQSLACETHAVAALQTESSLKTTKTELRTCSLRRTAGSADHLKYVELSAAQVSRPCIAHRQSKYCC